MVPGNTLELAQTDFVNFPFGAYGCAHSVTAAVKRKARVFIIRNGTPPKRTLACYLLAMEPKPEEKRTPTEEQVDMKDTVPQRSDNKGTKIEDLAGTGEQDSKGG